MTVTLHPSLPPPSISLLITHSIHVQQSCAAFWCIHWLFVTPKLPFIKSKKVSQDPRARGREQGNILFSSTIDAFSFDLETGANISIVRWNRFQIRGSYQEHEVIFKYTRIIHVQQNNESIRAWRTGGPRNHSPHYLDIPILNLGENGNGRVLAGNVASDAWMGFTWMISCVCSRRIFQSINL